MVDMYFYRDPEEQEKDQEEAALEDRKAITTGTGEDDFTADAADWGADVAATAGVTTGADWDTAGEWGTAAAGESWDNAQA
jgi:40S ribosomal protein SA C-terminus